MNKRIKKKRYLERKLAECLAREHLMMNAVMNHNDSITELEERMNRNAEATNKEIEVLRGEINVLKSENNQLRVDLNKATIEFNSPKKKSFWKR